MPLSRWLLLFAVMLTLASVGSAGVVEDAEETLKNVPADGPGRAAALSGKNAGHLPPQNFSMPSSGTSQSSSVSPARHRREVAEPSRSRTTPSSSAIAPTEPPGGVEAQKERDKRARETSDNVLTFGVVLLVLALIAAAGYVSRRLVGPSD